MTAGSPCVDVGNSLFSAGADLDANQRLVDDPATANTSVGILPFLDIGPYEFGSAPASSGIPGDINGDGKVDIFDFWILAAHWLEGVES